MQEHFIPDVSSAFIFYLKYFGISTYGCVKAIDAEQFDLIDATDFLLSNIHSII